ncbi:hypothetical protein LUZ60_003098 [Juncus effusus]|nr:hypothetical protein LUZ60_003098 [Juncus effusus]
MNPVHKKVPTLVVDGKPIAESLVILQYIDETWPEPPLMPQDPYPKSKVRFWADFIYQKIMPVIYTISISKGEPQAKSIDEFLTKFKTLERGISNEIYSEGPFIHGEQPGLLDVILGGCLPWLKLVQQGLDGVKLFDDKWVPILWGWMDEYAKTDVVNETTEMLRPYASV